MCGCSVFFLVNNDSCASKLNRTKHFCLSGIQGTKIRTILMNKSKENGETEKVIEKNEINTHTHTYNETNVMAFMIPLKV